MEACTLCGARSSRPAPIPATVFAGQRFDYMKCGDCGCTFVHPLPSQATLLEMYPPSYQGEPGPRELQRHRDEAGLMARYLSLGARVLDYGCGDGALVAEARRNGFLADGAEFNPAYVEMLRGSQSDAAFYDIAALADLEAGSFDALIFNNVLEHLTAPASTVRPLLRLLRPTGLVFAFGPIEHNATIGRAAIYLNDALKKQFRPGATSAHPPRHLTFTTYASQRRFFRDLGLQEVRFAAKDDGWPFPTTLSQASGRSGMAKWAIGLASRAVSAALPRLGNSFSYVGHPR